MTPFTFYATIDSDSVRSYMPDVPVMLPASSWSRKNMRAPRLPAHITERAADCGGFVATFRWGNYRYSPEEYVRWLKTFNPSWSATMDFCCEDEITAGHPGIVRERQQQTTAMAHYFWQHFKHTSWCWVPTIQGWHVDDYQYHARELRPLVTEMADYYGTGSPFRVGIGTLCRRANSATIRRVVGAVAQELPGIRLHLWGVKLAILQSRDPLPEQVVSVDSTAWNNLMKRGHDEWRASGLSQRRYGYTIALPKYRAKVERALTTPRQYRLFEEVSA